MRQLPSVANVKKCLHFNWLGRVQFDFNILTIWILYLNRVFYNKTLLQKFCDKTLQVDVNNIFLINFQKIQSAHLLVVQIFISFFETAVFFIWFQIFSFKHISVSNVKIITLSISYSESSYFRSLTRKFKVNCCFISHSFQLRVLSVKSLFDQCSSYIHFRIQYSQHKK